MREISRIFFVFKEILAFKASRLNLVENRDGQS